MRRHRLSAPLAALAAALLLALPTPAVRAQQAADPLAPAGATAAPHLAPSEQVLRAPEPVAPPQEDPQARIAAERRSVIVEAVQRIAPSVASVVIRGTQRVPIFDDPFYRDFFGYMLGPSVSRRYEVQSGSAVMISADGEFLTNQHVVGAADDISLLLPNGETRKAGIVGVSLPHDLALLKTDAGGLHAAQLGASDDLLVGEWLVAVGYPVGGRSVTTESRFRPTVTVGVVSALHRSFTPSSRRATREQFYPDMIQTDAAINPGNSGGPLANASGEVVGINTFILTDSGGSQGLGFAIPIERALKAADEMRRFGYVRPVDLSGISVRSQQMSTAEAAAYGLDGPHGLIIDEAGVAAAAGLRGGDVLLDVDGAPVDSLEEAQVALLPRFVGDRVVLGVWRNGGRLELMLTLGAAPRGQ